ncbi:MAG: uroporphyrinogen-III C-methyltransferase [Clostridiales bacterium]|nr:uroporphyrinogen-III C-methyltransferase [Clostridiales bacterium]
MNGKVYLVGAGPGDIGLFTIKGKELLQKAEAVLFDRLVGEDILSLIPNNAKKVDVGKKSGRHSVSQAEINEILVREAQANNVVVRLKGGDPYLFGRGGEEAEMLAKNGIPFEVVPGITSAIAAPACAGIPVTHRDYSSSLHIITGHGQRNKPLVLDYSALARVGGTLVFMMSLAAAAQITSGLLEAGMEATTPAAVIENGATAHQRRFVDTLAGLPRLIEREGVQTPAIIVVGSVCALSAQLDWFSRRPLAGCRILITRPREVAAQFGDILFKLGANITYYPCIRISPLEHNVDLANLDWLLFTSASGVETFFEHRRATNCDIRELGGKKIAVVGERTALALQHYGIRADFVPAVYNGARLARELLASGQVTAGQHIALLRAKQSGADIVDILRGAGLTVSDIAIYEALPGHSPPPRMDGFEYITFTSSSCVKNFVNANKKLDFTQITAIVIGEQTATAALAAGMKTIISDIATTASMAEKLQEVWQNRS